MKSFIFFLLFFLVALSKRIYVGNNLNYTTSCGSRIDDVCPSIGYVFITQLVEDHDEIILLDGVYSGSSNRGLSFKLTGVSISAQHPLNATIDLENEGRFAEIYGDMFSVNGIKFYRGKAEEGGVILFHGNQTLSVSDCIFQSNQASQNGGVFSIKDPASSVQVRTSSFAFNSAGRNGGSISTAAGITISDTQFSNSTTLNGFGGAIYFDRVKVSVISNATFVGCTSGQGGALWASGVEAYQPGYGINISDTQFESNTGVNGGSITATEQGIFSLDRCSFSNSSAAEGGALYSFSSRYDISQTTFKGCNANNHGGAIRAESHSLMTLQSASFKECTAFFQGGAILFSESKLNIENTNFLGNKAFNGGGGAIEVTVDCDVKLLNVSLLSNSGYKGGALFLSDRVKMEILGSTITNNTGADQGGGIYCSNSLLAINRTIIENNHSPDTNTSDFFCAAVPEGSWCDLRSDTNLKCDHPDPTKKPSNKQQLILEVLGIVFGCCAFLFCAISICLIIYTRRKASQSREILSSFEHDTKDSTLTLLEDYD